MFREYSPYQYEYIVWDNSAGIEAAWRFNGTGKECVEIFGDIAAGEIGLTEAVYGGQTTVQEYRQVFGSAASLASKQNPDYEFTPLNIGFSSSLQMSNSSASSTVSALEFGDMEQIGIRDRGANVVDGLDAGGGTRVDVKPFYSIVGDDLFFSSTTGLYAWTRANGLQLLMPSSASTLEHDLVTDGTALAWIESTNPDSDGFYTSAALYTSPLTTSAAGLAPHKVMGVGCRSGLCESSMAQGYVTVGLDPINVTTHQFMLVRLTDGAHWKLTDGSTDVWGLGKVVNSELWIPAQISGSNLSVERVTLASLGAPDTD